MRWLEEENSTYGSSGFFFLNIYILEVLGGLCVWVEVWKKRSRAYILKGYQIFLFSRVFCDG